VNSEELKVKSKNAKAGAKRKSRTIGVKKPIQFKDLFYEHEAKFRVVFRIKALNIPFNKAVQKRLLLVS
jgi:hypothetical protein